jgi:hypothetical protein
MQTTTHQFASQNFLPSNIMELFVGWTDEQKLADEEYHKYFRTVRNRFLSESDWTQMLDAPLSDELKVVWRAYRQALRDLPDTTDVANPVFPLPPGGNQTAPA